GFHRGFGTALQLLPVGRLDVVRPQRRARPAVPRSARPPTGSDGAAGIAAAPGAPAGRPGRGPHGGAARYPGGCQRRQRPRAGVGRPWDALLAAFGAEPSPAHLHAEGVEETVRHLRAEGLPILTLSERSLAPGVVVRPLTQLVALYPWTMVHHRELRHPGLDALHAEVDELARRERW